MKRIIVGWVMVGIGTAILLAQPFLTTAATPAGRGFSALIWVGAALLVWGYRSKYRAKTHEEAKHDDA